MSAHFAYKHMPASGVGILDDQYRPYSTGGVGAYVPAYLPQEVDPGHIDSRPLLFPPDIHVGSVPSDLPLIDATPTIHLPVLQRFKAFDIIKMRLGIVQMSPFIVSMSAPEATFKLGALMSTAAMLVMKQFFGAKVGIADSFTENLTQTFDS